MGDFLRVIAWLCDEKFSLKKSCFYLYIRRRYVSNWSETVVGGIFAVLYYVELISLFSKVLKNQCDSDDLDTLRNRINLISITGLIKYTNRVLGTLQGYISVFFRGYSLIFFKFMNKITDIVKPAVDGDIRY